MIGIIALASGASSDMVTLCSSDEAREDATIAYMYWGENAPYSPTPESAAEKVASLFETHGFEDSERKVGPLQEGPPTEDIAEADGLTTFFLVTDGRSNSADVALTVEGSSSRFIVSSVEWCSDSAPGFNIDDIAHLLAQ